MGAFYLPVQLVVSSALLMFNPGCTRFMTMWVCQTPLVTGSSGCVTIWCLMTEPSVMPSGLAVHYSLFFRKCASLLKIMLRTGFKILSGPPLSFSHWSWPYLPRHPFLLLLLLILQGLLSHGAHTVGLTVPAAGTAFRVLPCSGLGSPSCPLACGLGAVLLGMDVPPPESPSFFLSFLGGL